MSSRAATEYRYEKLTWPEINDAVDRRQVVLLTVLEQRIADGSGIADETDAAGAGVMDMASLHQHAAIVVVHENSIAADLVELTIQNAHVFGPCQHEGAAAIDRPVRSQQRFFAVHKGACCVAHRESLQGDELDGRCFRPLQLDQAPESNNFDLRLREIAAALRFEVER